MPHDWIIVLAISLLMVALVLYSLLLADHERKRDGKGRRRWRPNQGEEKPRKAA